MALSSLKVCKAVENKKYTIKHVELFLKMEYGVEKDN